MTVDIDNMEAGPEMDALVAERVMGWSPAEHGVYWRESPKWVAFTNELPGYSTDIAAAWQVVEKLRAQGTYLLVEAYADYWECSYFAGSVQDDVCYTGLGATAPLAICKAALKAVETDK